MKNTLNFAGELDLEELSIFSEVTGKTVYIENIMSEFCIYESLYSGSLSGYVTLNESLDLISHVPMVGNEILRIKCKTPTFPNSAYIDQNFIIYKIDNRSIVAEKSQLYTLHFFSIEQYIDLNKKLSRAINGQLSYIVKNLVETNLGFNSDKEIDIEETENSFKFVIPQWSPYKTINFITARSISKKYGTADYLFWEDTKKFNFTSISKLIDVDMPFMYYQHNQANLRNMRELGLDIDPYSIISDIQFTLDFDISNRMLQGMYASKLINFDILTKSVNIKEVDYFNEFGKKVHLDKDKSYPISSLGTIRNNESHVNYYPSHSYIFDDYENENPLQWVLQRKMSMQELEAHSIQITVPGRTDMTVGKVIYIDYNTAQFHADSTDTDEGLYKGNYLVTALSHRMSRNQHEMVITAIKNDIIRDLTKG